MTEARDPGSWWGLSISFKPMREDEARLDLDDAEVAQREARHISRYLQRRFHNEPGARLVWQTNEAGTSRFSVIDRHGSADAHLVLTRAELLEARSRPELIDESIDELELRWRQARFYCAMFARCESARFSAALRRVQP